MDSRNVSFWVVQICKNVFLSFWLMEQVYGNDSYHGKRKIYRGYSVQFSVNIISMKMVMCKLFICHLSSLVVRLAGLMYKSVRRSRFLFWGRDITQLKLSIQSHLCQYFFMVYLMIKIRCKWCFATYAILIFYISMLS